MSIRRREIKLLWQECLGLFLQVNGKDLPSFLIDLIEIVRKYEAPLKQYANADDFLDFVLKMNPNKFEINKTVMNVGRLWNSNIERPPSSEKNVWERISDIIWLFTTYQTEEICFSCRADLLRILTDKEGIKIYKYCETCFCAKSEDGKVFSGSKGLYPADTKLLINKGFIKKGKCLDSP